MWYTIRRAVENKVGLLRDSVKSLTGSHALNRAKDLLREASQRADELERGLATAFSHSLIMARQRHRSLEQRLEALSPPAVLARGYTIVRKGGQVVTSARRLRTGDLATIEFHDGEKKTRVEP
jgi:exodeoxyribonuclease VII large subunit